MCQFRVLLEQLLPGKRAVNWVTERWCRFLGGSFLLRRRSGQSDPRVYHERAIADGAERCGAPADDDGGLHSSHKLSDVEADADVEVAVRVGGGLG